MYAFISYQTTDKHAARRIQRLLEEVGVTSFLAHEDIQVSAVWRDKILEEIGKSDLFISLLSANYFESPWCVQESGIAAFRDIIALPLSLDGSIPQGFAGNIQSMKIDPETVSIADLLPGIVAHDFDLGVSLIKNLIASSRSFRGAEANFRLILPHIGEMSDVQVKLLLEKVASNSQVHHAGQCANDYIPPLLESHGHLLDNKTREFLEDVCAQYR